MTVRSMNFGEPGVKFNVGNGDGMTAYNATGAPILRGDVCALINTGVNGREVSAIIPVTNTIQGTLGICMKKIPTATIGKFQIRGLCDFARVLGHASLAVSTFLQTINVVAFDGTVTNVAFVAGYGTTKDTITDSDSGLVTDGFLKGMRISIAGSTSNDGTYEIYSVAAGVITLTTIGALTSEDGVAGLTMQAQGYLTYDAASDNANTFAVAKEAYTTTTAVATKNVFLHGREKVVPAS